MTVHGINSLLLCNILVDLRRVDISRNCIYSGVEVVVYYIASLSNRKILHHFLRDRVGLTHWNDIPRVWRTSGWVVKLVRNKSLAEPCLRPQQGGKISLLKGWQRKCVICSRAVAVSVTLIVEHEERFIFAVVKFRNPNGTGKLPSKIILSIDRPASSVIVVHPSCGIQHAIT